MGLFSFLKNVGKKRTPVKAEPTIEELRAQNLDMARMIFTEIKESGIEINELSIIVDGDRAIVKGITKSQADKEKVILEVGNTTGIAEVDEAIEVEVPTPQSRFYEVKKGDSLSKIAKEMYNDAMKYPVIFEANKPMLKSEDLIYPGQLLRIPELTA